MKTLLALLLLIPSLSMAEIYNGTLIDAHSQKGSLISAELLSKKINEVDVDYTLLSFRQSPSKIKQDLKIIQDSTNDKVRYLIPTKLFKFTQKSSDPKLLINEINKFVTNMKKSKIDYVGFGEIIVQHAPHNHKKLKYEGINLDLSSKRVTGAIDIILGDKKPVILHVELNDYEDDSKKILNQIIDLAKRNPNENFLLMHMAQIEFDEAALIIKQTNNIHFITSHADNETFMRMKNKEKGHSQSGWINIFDDYNNLKKNWMELMNENPRRFVLALDNVFDGHWLRGYATRVFIWRKALFSLNKQAALLIACENANDYFKLDIKCLEKRS
jgi:hypothetical protein